jgi:hypothetical protein
MDINFLALDIIKFFFSFRRAIVLVFPALEEIIFLSLVLRINLALHVTVEFFRLLWILSTLFGNKFPV